MLADLAEHLRRIIPGLADVTIQVCEGHGEVAGEAKSKDATGIYVDLEPIKDEGAAPRPSRKTPSQHSSSNSSQATHSSQHGDSKMNDMNDGWGAVPADENIIRGSMLKFLDGEWTDRDSGDVLNGRQFAVMGVTVSWDRWFGGEVEHRITPPGEPHPKRKELPDQDESQWEAGLDGKPTDPQQDARYVYLVDQQSAAEHTYVTRSYGGRVAVSTLRNQIANMRAAHPRAVAIVELRSGKMKTGYGPKPKPWLKVVGWVNGPNQAPATIESQRTKTLGHRDELDDDIPFK
jgi:hypothetical protein